MTRSESKYFATAEKMDKAFLSLLEKKDFSFITVKEICQKANVNRSTFYLHYETIGDLLSESVRYINDRFLAFMKKDTEVFITKIHDCQLNELYLITPEYLKPYLSFIKENKRLFGTALKNASVLGVTDTYESMSRYVFAPILERYCVPESDRVYIMSYYIHGVMAVITEWLNNNCTDSIDHIICILQGCVMPHKEDL